LRLDGNELAALPETFGKLSALRRLWLNDNRLLSLPRSFGMLKKLEWLQPRDWGMLAHGLQMQSCG